MISIELLRQYRMGGFAVFDLSLAFLGMGLLSPLLSRLLKFIKIEIPKKNWLFLTLPIGLLIHLLIGQKTLMTTNFLDVSSNYALKILIISCLILGYRGIKISSKKT